MQLGTSRLGEVQPREKYVFLMRHAQSTWNQNVDLVKTLRGCPFDGISVKDIVAGAAHLAAREVWHKDHPISEEGLRQTEALRQKILALQLLLDGGCPDADGSESSGSSSSSGGRRQRPEPQPGAEELEPERSRRYYEAFLTQRLQIYCSPMLRALQTAHLVLPEKDGWGSIKLLKDARERFSFVFERDCLGTGVGRHIVDRAMQMGQGLPGLQDRVDATDCAQKWWSDGPETEAEVEVRLTTLWRRLLEEDGNDSCVLVTHSNLIKALLMRFGGIDEEECCHLADLMDSPRGEGKARSTSGGRGSFELLEATGEVGSEEAAAVDFNAEEELNVASPRSQDSASDASADEMAEAWQVVGDGPQELRQLKVERLQNCGVLGLRCLLEPPLPGVCGEVDGWIDVNAQAPAAVAQCAAKPQWVARDALLMFDSVLVK